MFAADMTDPAIAKHSQTMREKASDIEAKLLFIELELAALDETAYPVKPWPTGFSITQPGCASCAPRPPHVFLGWSRC